MGAITVHGGNVVASAYNDNKGEDAAGIGGGDQSSGGTVNANGGAFGADIGGGREGKSGTIHITDGNVTARGGTSAAGIGSGHKCGEKTDAVNVTIDGGTINAHPGGGHDWNTGTTTHNFTFYSAHAGTAIGAGGNLYKGHSSPDSLSDEAYFSGSIILNGGEVNVHGRTVSSIGAVEDASLVEDTGRVEFNGARVVKHSGVGSYYAPMVKANEGQIVLKENDTLHQMVMGDDYWNGLELNNSAAIALKDDRINILRTYGNGFVAVIPCDHRNSDYEDKGENHSRTCKYCTYETDAEEHTYGELTYTWTDDNTQVTASLVCTGCKHEISETVDAASEVTKEAACSAKGETTYTATFKNPAFETQTKTEPIPKKVTPITTKTALKSATAKNQKYTGKALKPAVTVKDAKGKTVPASAYTVKYTNNVNVGTATATITAKKDSKYTGTVKTVRSTSRTIVRSVARRANGALQIEPR